MALYGQRLPAIGVDVPLPRPALPFAALPAILALGALPGCEKPDLRAGVDEVRYVFNLDIGLDASAGFVCVASVTDVMGRGTLRTKPFRVLPGKTATEALDEPVSGSRLEATVKVDPAGARATYRARLLQKGQRSVVFEATRDIPKA